MKRILLPLDGSPCAEAAIPVARELVSDLDGTLVLVSVGNLPETTVQAESERQELLAMLKRTVKRFDLEADLRVDTGGDPVQGILDIASEEQVDLIVMSTHGRSGWSEFTQGSTARDVVGDGSLPVLLVRPRSGT